ncbi:hypothetical protein V3C99_016858, partial [Haemonchus contortus]
SPKLLIGSFPSFSLLFLLTRVELFGASELTAMIRRRKSTYCCLIFLVIILFLYYNGYLNVFQRSHLVLLKNEDVHVNPEEQYLMEHDKYYALARKQLSNFKDVEEWCGTNAEYPGLNMKLPSPEEVAKIRRKADVWGELSSRALLITNNFPWKSTIGLLQRLYQPHFKVTIFCGTFYPELFMAKEGFPDIVSPFNYINVSEKEMDRGVFAYHCLVRARALQLDVKGYFVMSDDVTFNFWHPLHLEKVLHPTGITYEQFVGMWWPSIYGKAAVQRALALITNKYKNDEGVQRMFEIYQNGLSSNGFKQKAHDQLIQVDGWSISDLYYVPAPMLDYYSQLMNIFYEAGVFHEIAISKFLYSVPHTRLYNSDYKYLWEDRIKWPELYHENLVFIHPIKLNSITDNNQRARFCNSVVSTFRDALFG